jgi:F420-dependent oxidoreductase-like protein
MLCVLPQRHIWYSLGMDMLHAEEHEEESDNGRSGLRFGMTIDVSAPLPGVVDQVRRMAEAGLASALATQVTGYYDSLTMLALAGYQVPDIELVTGVVPVYPHHPLALATQALTTQAATAGRLTLGIGLSHKFVVEGVFGYSFDRPVRHMREYLEVLVPALRREQVAYQGETLRVATRQPLDVEAPAPPVLVAALGPRMLELAGTLADGTVTWMTGPATVATHIVPSLRAAADRAGRPAPRVQVVLPMCVTDDPDRAHEDAVQSFGIYDMMPSYRAMLDREGAASPADIALIGDEETVVGACDRLAEAGATDLTAVAFGTAAERDRALDLLSGLVADRSASAASLAGDEPSLAGR